ncbi:MAG: recombinase family protein [Thermoleophilaceae bacterium]
MPPTVGALRARTQTTQEAEPGGPSSISANGSREPRYPATQNRAVLALGYASERRYTPGDDVELRRQAAAINGFCASRGWQLVGLMRDIRTPGQRRTSRPSLRYALDQLRLGGATCLVVAELTCLSPSVAHLGDVLDAVEHTGARLVSLEPAIDTDTASGRAAIHALKSVSRWERARREEMTSAARAKVVSPLASEPKLKRRIRRMRNAGMTLQSIADALNEEGIPTVRGGATWRPSSVQAALGYRRPHQNGRAPA